MRQTGTPHFGESHATMTEGFHMIFNSHRKMEHRVVHKKRIQKGMLNIYGMRAVVVYSCLLMPVAWFAAAGSAIGADEGTLGLYTEMGKKACSC